MTEVAVDDCDMKTPKNPSKTDRGDSKTASNDQSDDTPSSTNWNDEDAYGDSLFEQEQMKQLRTLVACIQCDELDREEVRLVTMEPFTPSRDILNRLCFCLNLGAPLSPSSSWTFTCALLWVPLGLDNIKIYGSFDDSLSPRPENIFFVFPDRPPPDFRFGARRNGATETHWRSPLDDNQQLQPGSAFWFAAKDVDSAFFACKWRKRKRRLSSSIRNSNCLLLRIVAERKEATSVT